MDLDTAHRLDQRTGVGRIGLVALPVGAHILRRQQLHLVALCLQRARPMMRRAARLHHRQAAGMIAEKLFELPAPQARAALDPVPPIRDRDFKAAVCQIDAASNPVPSCNMDAETETPARGRGY